MAVASIGSQPAYRNVAELERRTYIKALSATHKALRDQSVTTSDAALVTVLLLSLYESATGLEYSVAEWDQHIDGAVAILKARGQGQFTTVRSRCAFRAVRTRMLSFCIQTQWSVQSFPGPRGWMSDMSDEDDEYAFNFLTVAVEVTDLSSRARLLLALPESSRNTKYVEILLAQA